MIRINPTDPGPTLKLHRFSGKRFLKNKTESLYNDFVNPLIILNANNKTQENTNPGLLEKVEVREPSFYKVILFNDDFTPMDFVTHVLEKIYNKPPEQARKIMLDVHHSGQGVAGVFSFEIAETKVFLTNNLSKQNKYPLKCSMEKD